MTFGETTEVIVIGAGLAGVCAAVSAAESGSRVTLIEKQPRPGGSTVLSGGFFALSNTPLQHERAIEDTADLLYDDLETVGAGQADSQMLRDYCDGQAEFFSWLTKMGVVFSSVEHSAGQSVPRSHRTDPKQAIERLMEAADASGRVTLETECRADRVLTDEEGSVLGVRVRGARGSVAIEAQSGVVLTSGGFTRSEELLGIFAPNQAKAVRIGGAGNTGDGLRMAWKLGAGLRDMGFIKGTFGTHPSTRPERHEILLLFYLGAIIVNRSANRFVDESLSYKQLGDAGLSQAGATAWQIFNRSVFDASPVGVPLFDPRPYLERGMLLEAGSIEDLATLARLDPDVLADTIDRYNRSVAANGRDAEFGRDGLCNHAGALVTIEKPPFYAFASTTALLATYCGLTVTPWTQVLDVFGEAIPRLFAAGEIVGGFHGPSYMTGTSLGKAAFFGRKAGAAAAHGAPTINAPPERNTRS